MHCRHAEELLSDHFDGTLQEPLLSELEHHLETCGECAALRATLAEVVAALHAVPLFDAPPGLAARVAAAALRDTRPATVVTVTPAAPRLPLWMQVAAAAAAVAITGGLAYAGRALGTPAGLGTHLAERTANAGGYLVERKERLVEDVRLLRAVVATAFEERLDRVGERVDDYRRLLERRRALEQRDAEKPSKGGSDSSRDFPNPRTGGRVQRCEGRTWPSQSGAEAVTAGPAEGATT